MSGRASGKANWCSSTKSPTAPADRSYGIAVAKLAGLPPLVLARAKAVLAKLEAGRDATGGIAAGLDDLPLFAASRSKLQQSTRWPRRSRRSIRTRSRRARRSRRFTR